MDKYSYIANADPAYIESLYQDYRKDPASIDEEWSKFFEGFDFSTEQFGDEAVPENFQKEFKVINLINGYRSRGHLFTATNPVRERRKYSPTLDLVNFGLDESDLDTIFQAGTQIGLGPASLRDIIAMLEETYCRSIGVEYMYIRNPERIEWLKEKIEPSRFQATYNADEKKHILHKINQAVVFENFLHTKFVGQKRFSLEGAETLIPALDAVIERGAELGVEECIFGMAHRGRLNVLANIFNKTYSDIFSEFEGKDFEDAAFEGDVKYHLGFSSDVKTEKGKTIHLSMTANPSHLEAVDPVVEGITRAKLENKYGDDPDKIVPILIHGDASIAGQGVVYEIIQMQKLKGYQTGGTIHIVVNNQIGFTTNYLDARSSTYCTDVGKVTLCPIFHVNGDDAEAVAHACQLAMEYRQKFHLDVFIDLLCYRKYGHNESDEPRFTQPILYKAIAGHPNPREIYSAELTKQGLIHAQVAKEMEQEFRGMLQERLNEAKQLEKGKVVSYLEGEWKGLRQSKDHDFNTPPKTGVLKKDLVAVAKKLSDIPADVKLFKKVENLLKDRRRMLDEDVLDWGMCELLAYGTLLKEGHDIRISGQDVERGTFSHRHAILTQEESEETYVPLRHISKDQGKFMIYNSFLSEYAVLGFDYGYSLATPFGLTVWEAQFGDFANGAQIIIDQFISSAEDKWKRMSGLVMLLPHGYEGQGAEHSSARMERFLQLCAEDNLLIVNCTSPANFFHVIRRQLNKDIRKPLVVFTPKSLLRHPRCLSKLEELSKDRFQLVMDDGTDPKKAKRLLLCTGKIYFELEDYKDANKRDDVAVVRMEQLYPFPYLALNKILDKYKDVDDVIWVQEEPENMGAWSFVMRHLHDIRLRLVSRYASASPASGSHKRFEKRQQEVIEKAFNS
jgi:2-oxoglutarate dehydrogenase E1 component